MTIAVSVATVVLGLLFVLAGLNKVAAPDPAIRALVGGVLRYRALAAAEVAAGLTAIAAVSSSLTDVLASVVAVAFVVVMAGALAANRRLGRRRDLGINIAVGAIALVVAVGTPVT